MAGTDGRGLKLVAVEIPRQAFARGGDSRSRGDWLLGALAKRKCVDVCVESRGWWVVVAVWLWVSNQDEGGREGSG